MRPLARGLVIGWTVLSLGGCCWLPADGVVSVHGEAPGPAEGCVLELQRHRNDEPPRSIRQIEVAGAFEESFVISPCAANYTATLRCGDRSAHHTFDFPDDLPLREPLRIGAEAPTPDRAAHSSPSPGAP